MTKNDSELGLRWIRPILRPILQREKLVPNRNETKTDPIPNPLVSIRVRPTNPLNIIYILISSNCTTKKNSK